MITVVPSTSPKSPARFYGAPCLPTVKGLLLECDSKDEYLVAREAYEASEGNCNTCVHLVRPPRGHQQLDLAPLDKDHPLGRSCSTQEMQDEAVKAGKAEYYLDSSNTQQWRWKAP